MTTGGGSWGDRESRTKGFYAFLFVLGVLMFMLAIAGHVWLTKLEEKRREDDRQAAIARGAEKRPAPVPTRPKIVVERPDTDGVSGQPGGNVQPEAGTRDVPPETTASDERLDEIVRELEDAKSAGNTEDTEEEARWKDCSNNFKQIGLYLVLWVSKYGQEKYYPSADPEGAVRQMLETDADKLLQCTCSGTPHKYTFVPDLPKNAMDVLPPMCIVAHESQPNRKGCRHVLFMDGHVERLDEAGFQQMMARHAEALKALETKEK
ncbi:MAG: hypothetical protein RDV41_08830 [Planctomycetota bacterium]|nr:hypothetical protein [Planctomycetota bacterium]